jgi:hypothetical protein
MPGKRSGKAHDDYEKWWKGFLMTRSVQATTKPELEFVSPFPVHEGARRLVNAQRWRFLDWQQKVELSTMARGGNRFAIYSPVAKVSGFLNPYDANSAAVAATSYPRYTVLAIVAMIGVVLVIGLPLVFTSNLILIGLSIVVTLGWLAFLWYLGSLERARLMRFVKRVLEYQDKRVDVEPQPVSSFKRI